jgi:bifunctional polynucleotide phosphatase/kinase
MVAVDNTNADIETRSRWITLARERGVPARCVWLRSTPEICKHNEAVRSLNNALFNPENRGALPSVAFMGFQSRFKEPKVEEGFQDVVEIPFQVN